MRRSTPFVLVVGWALAMSCSPSGGGSGGGDGGAGDAAEDAVPTDAAEHDAAGTDGATGGDAASDVSSDTASDAPTPAVRTSLFDAGRRRSGCSMVRWSTTAAATVAASMSTR